MYENETNERPIYTIKIFNKIQFKNESTRVFGLQGMECLLENANGLNNLSIL